MFLGDFVNKKLSESIKFLIKVALENGSHVLALWSAGALPHTAALGGQQTFNSY